MTVFYIDKDSYKRFQIAKRVDDESVTFDIDDKVKQIKVLMMSGLTENGGISFLLGNSKGNKKLGTTKGFSVHFTYSEKTNNKLIKSIGYNGGFTFYCSSFNIFYSGLDDCIICNFQGNVDNLRCEISISVESLKVNYS